MVQWTTLPCSKQTIHKLLYLYALDPILIKQPTVALKRTIILQYISPFIVLATMWSSPVSLKKNLTHKTKSPMILPTICSNVGDGVFLIISISVIFTCMKSWVVVKMFNFHFVWPNSVNYSRFPFLHGFALTCHFLSFSSRTIF